MFYPLGKNSEKPYGGGIDFAPPPPPLVRPRVINGPERKYISYQIDIYDVLEKVERTLFQNIFSMPGHPLYLHVPKTKESSARLRVPSSQLPN